MIWKTTNTLGQEVVWYSEDEYNKLKEKLDYFEKCHKDLDNYIPALINGELGYIKKSEVLKNNNNVMAQFAKQILQKISEVIDD